jgi:hypothetical protein
VGAGGVIPMTTMKKVILLKRDPQDSTIVKPLATQEALDYLLAHDFCNPHQLVRDKRKVALRSNFFEAFFKQTDVYLVNTTATPQRTQDEIRRVLELSKV